MNEFLSLSSSLVIEPLRAGLCAGRDNQVDLLVRVQAPDLPPQEGAARPPQAVALVIDKSGSMRGDAIQEARRCAEFVVSRMRKSDVISLVQFDDQVTRLQEAVPQGDGRLLRAAIHQIRVGGNTDLHGGWLEGAETLTAVSGTALKRVILLSDGQANIGLTDQEAIATQCRDWAARGISTSTYGLGDGFNEDLMVAMARAGSGNHYYGDKAEDLMEPFEQELDLMANLAMRQVRLQLSAPDGLGLEVLNDSTASAADWQLPDMAWDTEAWVVVRLTLPAAAMPAPGERMTLLRAQVTALTAAGDPVSLERTSLALPVRQAGEWQALPESALVARRVLEVDASRMLSAMRQLAQEEEWPALDKLLSEAEQRFSGHEWLTSIMQAMRGVASSRSRERMMKESFFSSRKLSARLAAKNEQAANPEGTDEPAFLRRKSLQGKRDH